MDGERLRDSLFFKRLERKFRGALLRASAEGAILCVPQTASLITTVLTVEDVENHILVPSAVRGEWVSLNGKAATVSAGEVVAGAGYRRRVAARILATEKVAVTFSGKEVRRLTPASSSSAGEGRVSARRLSGASTASAASGAFPGPSDSLFEAGGGGGAGNSEAGDEGWTGGAPAARDRALSVAASTPTSPLKMALLRGAGHDPLTSGGGGAASVLAPEEDSEEAAHAGLPLSRALDYAAQGSGDAGADEGLVGRAREGSLAAVPELAAGALGGLPAVLQRVAAALVTPPLVSPDAQRSSGAEGGDEDDDEAAPTAGGDDDRTTVSLADWLQPRGSSSRAPSGAATPRHDGSDGEEEGAGASAGRRSGRSSARPSQPSTPRRALSTSSGGLTGSPSRASSSRRFPSLFDTGSTPVPQPAAPLTVTLTAYFLSQPLEGGLAAASSIDDIDHGAVMRYVAMLKTSPDTEAVFTRLEKAVTWSKKRLAEVAAAVDAGLLPALEHSRPLAGPAARRRELPVGPTAVCLYQVEDPDRGITSPALTAMDVVRDQLRLECQAAVDCLLCTSFYAGEAPASRPGTRRLLMQVLESFCMEELAEPALRALRLCGWDLAIGKLAAVLRARAPLSALDTGIKEEFICNLNPVVASLGLLSSAATPLEKLHCLRDASLLLQKCVERHLEARGVDLADVEFATDDMLVMLLFAIVKGHPLHATADLPLQLDYITRFNFAATPDELSRSRLGYYLANFQQCLIFFDDEAERLAQAEAAEARAARPRAGTGGAPLVRSPSGGALATPGIS